MLQELRHYSFKSYPKNFLLKRPAAGAFIIALFNYLFLMLYRPVHTQPAYLLSYELTMAIYCAGAGLAAFTAIILLNHSGFFRAENKWNILKEIAAVVIVIFAMGMAVYLLAFIVETPGERWNLTTMMDSFRLTFMIGGIPLYLFTIININELFTSTITHSGRGSSESQREPEQWISIDTPLIKEELGFYPGEFCYAESDGNYVNVYLKKGDQIREEVIRISISSVEEQLADFPFIMRTHRAFIVNLTKVTEASGNALGYRLKISGIQKEIPVSRRHTGTFRSLYNSPDF
jgi:hypothetical protein